MRAGDRGLAQQRPHQRGEPRRDANLPPDVFEVDDRRVRLERRDERLELRLLDEAARRDDRARSPRRGRRRCADAGPVEKFSIAGTRRSACSAKNVTSAARDVGSSTPTRSPGARPLREHAAERVAGRDEPAVAHRLLLEIVGDRRGRRRAAGAPRAARRTASCRCGAAANIDCTISSPSARRSATRRARPVTPSGAVSTRGGSTRMRIRGNSRRRTLPASRENGVNSTPSMRTGHAARPSCARRSPPGPSYTFISEPVVVMRPSGKDDAGRAALDRADHRANRQRVGRIDRQRVDERRGTASPTTAARSACRRRRSDRRAETRRAAVHRGTTRDWRRSPPSAAPRARARAPRPATR